MYKILKSLKYLVLLFFFYTIASAAQPDSAWIFAYSTDKNSHKNGLHFAWSTDQTNWHSIGPEHSFLKSDYGNWGSEKRMHNPYIIRTQDKWHLVFSVNDRDGTFAYCSSDNLTDWIVQRYPYVLEKGNCLWPYLDFNPKQNEYKVNWLSIEANDTSSFSVTTNDFLKFSAVESVDLKSFKNNRSTVIISGIPQEGTIHKVEWPVIDHLLKAQKLAEYNHKLNTENPKTDSIKFAHINNISALITPDTGNTKRISDNLMGIFFEDINYAADGGIYAELVQNRGFEYDLSDKKFRDSTWTHTKAWHLNGDNISMSISASDPLHENNKHHAVLNITEPGGALINDGFDGIVIKSGDKYDFSFFGKNNDTTPIIVKVQLINKNGDICGETELRITGNSWGKYESVFSATGSATKGSLKIIPQSAGKISLDMISLFPQKTFKGRKNGLRPDLVKAITDLKPHFVRFPGGCVAHGDGMANAYRWKNTIGPLEARVPQRNIWRYHQSAGLGYYEYFQFCEDIGAEPIPVVAAGVPCQNSSTGGAGQQSCIPIDEMDDYIQEVFDLIEWANGDPTTTWGKLRAEAGHPEPFNLKYLGIGNEDLISPLFEERFTMIYNAVREKYPEIIPIGTVGPFTEGPDYRTGWEIAQKLSIPIVDEHYYRQPGWFINNQNYYDQYDRSASKVYLGEYASWGNKLYNALAEAIYMTGFERNGDIVEMVSYAPLFAKVGNTQWWTDLIFFTNTEVIPTPNYYIQKMYGQNSGDSYIGSDITLSDNTPGVSQRVGASFVKDTETGDLIVKLVNILPVSVKTTVDLSDFNFVTGKTSIETLSGDPGSTDAEPATKSFNIQKQTELQLAPYSFSVFRVKLK